MDYSQALTWIHSHKANGRRPHLERMRAILDKIGNPQNTFPAIHLVGTNGKGSTTSFLQHILSASGYKTGTFTSPFITRFNERIAVDKQEISDKDLIQTVQLLQPVIEDKDFLITYGVATEFELVTALMFLYFSQLNPVDIAIIEAGIGGYYDSTNVFTPIAVVCPSISFDHQETLGDSLTQIAKHKSGVLKEGIPFIFGQMNNSVQKVFYNKARNLNCPTYEIEQDFSFEDTGKAFNFVYDDLIIPDIRLKLLGQHQKANACLAAMTSLILAQTFMKISQKSIKEGLKETSWPGRGELIEDNLMLDGAHNKDSMEKLANLLRNEFSDRKIHILFAGLARKDFLGMLEQICDYDVSVTCFDFPQANLLEDYPENFPRITDYNNWLALTKENPDDLYVVTGSLYFISEIRNALLTQSKDEQTDFIH